MRLKKNVKKALWNYLALFILCAGGLVWLSQDALALRVSLKRVVFEGSKRSEILTVINNSSEPETYRIEFLKFTMDEGFGALRLLEEGETVDGVKWADSMIRFAPRRVTVPPGGAQQIRLLLRRPKDIEKGEYRSHLRILKEIKPQPFEKDLPANQPNIQLRVQPGISLPVFVRHGRLEAEANITNPKLTKIEGGLKIAFRVNRTGERSVYGDFDFVCNDGGQQKILRTVRGLAVYTETEYRDLHFDIELSDSTAANCSVVDIIYRADPNDSQYSGRVLAQANASL